MSISSHPRTAGTKRDRAETGWYRAPGWRAAARQTKTPTNHLRQRRPCGTDRLKEMAEFSAERTTGSGRSTRSIAEFASPWKCNRHTISVWTVAATAGHTQSCVQRFKSARQAQQFLPAYDQIANVFASPEDHATAAKFHSVSIQSFHDLGQDDRRRPRDRESRAIALASGAMHEAAALAMSARPQWLAMAQRISMAIMLSAGGPPNRSHRDHLGISKKNVSESQITVHGRMNSANRPVQKMTMIGLGRSRNMAFSGAISAKNCRSSGIPACRLRDRRFCAEGSLAAHRRH
jgi:hypothetical protein